jgi:hypothetical protein
LAANNAVPEGGEMNRIRAKVPGAWFPIRTVGLVAFLLLYPCLAASQSAPESGATLVTSYQGPPDAPAAKPAASQAPVTSTTDWTYWKNDCYDLFHKPGKKQSFIGCATYTFTARPFHFLVQSIVPGSGVGGGGRFTKDLNKQGSGAQNQLIASSVITIRQFWFAELKFTSIVGLPQDWNKSQPRQSFKFNAYARNRSLPLMTFYGLGPNTNVLDSVKFRQRDTSAGIEASSPIPYLGWLSAGGKIEGLWPDIGGVTGTNVVSIQQVYTEQTAPGLVAHPPMVHERIYLNPKWHPQGAVFSRIAFDYLFFYNFYQDTDTGHYSFRRFEAKLNHRFYPVKKKFGSVVEDNSLDVTWRYSVSDASANHAVPFFLQETLGGSDIDNQPSLRAFRDYRFRGPDLMAVQAEYDHKLCKDCGFCKEGITRTLCSHLGVLVAYDAGKVALRKSDLNFSDLHQSFGGGISIILGRDVVFKMAVALGGGEGVHPYFNVPNVL